VDLVIRTVRAAAVLVAKDGLGPWEMPEMRACLTQMVRRNLPVIPVLLPGAPKAPDLPVFLGENTWVDLRQGITKEGLDKLVWGITGRKPSRRKSQQKKTLSTQPRPPRLHNLPFSTLGDLLKGRDADLQRLQDSFSDSASATAITQPQALHGLGGLGKTRLAVEYAWRSGDRYDAAFFVVVESPEALRSGLASLAGPALLYLTEYKNRDEDEVLAAVLRWFRDHDRWLLILDNADTPAAVQAVGQILPSLSNGRVLITSRVRDWPPGIRKQSLETLSLDEAQKFLLQRTENERTRSKDDPEQALRLAEELGGLPLALEQAAAYISHHQMTLAEYLEDWQRERGKVLAWYDGSVMQYPASVAVTWQKTFDQLSPTAAAILRLTAWLAPDPIPLAMFEEGEEFVTQAVALLGNENGEPGAAGTIKEAVSELAAYSMVTREGETFTVHRMVQEVLRFRIPEEGRRGWIELSLKLVNRFSPDEPEDVRTWPVWDLLRPHAVLVIGYADQVEIAHPTARLMNELAQFYYSKALQTEAEPLMRRALQITEEFFGKQHPEVAKNLNNLAALLWATNQLAEAEPLMWRALQIGEDSLGPLHPNVAIRLYNLAALLQATNRLAEAEPLIRRALQIDEDSFGPLHPEVATDLNNLAQLLQATNRLAEAEPLMRRALQIDEDSFGPLHPHVARDLNNLARLLWPTNRLAEAEPLMRRALEIFEQSLGPEHPKTQIARGNLALLLQEIEAGNPSEPGTPRI
jgi:tetratricopeptide (TPR) repeat protein